MDSFYIENASKFQDLVKSFDASAARSHISSNTAKPIDQQEPITEECNPDMVVSVRIRPMLEDDIDGGFPCSVFPRPTDPSSCSQAVDLHDLHNHPSRRPRLKSSNYKVDKVFGSHTTTKEVYDSVVLNLVSNAQNGGVSTLFAYGQTGSGKTFTIDQLQRLTAVSLIDWAHTHQKNVYLSVFDLASNSACDLLNARKPISILEDSTGSINLVGATEYKLSAKDKISYLLEQASASRRTASTSRNDASSRSHSICQFRISDSVTAAARTAIAGPCSADGLLYLVDLAGSEVARDVVKHGPERMRETRAINISLSVLKDCIRRRAEIEMMRTEQRMKERVKTIYVPVRQSTLTKVLKHVFDPQSERASKTAVVACVSPSLADVMPSRNTLRYAELLRGGHK